MSAYQRVEEWFIRTRRKRASTKLVRSLGRTSQFGWLNDGASCLLPDCTVLIRAVGCYGRLRAWHSLSEGLHGRSGLYGMQWFAQTICLSQLAIKGERYAFSCRLADGCRDHGRCARDYRRCSGVEAADRRTLRTT